MQGAMLLIDKARALVSSTQDGERIDDATRVWLKMGAKDAEKTRIEQLGSSL